MKILAVDTSSSNCSVSITEVDENKNFNIIVSKNNNDEKTHSQKLMPMIDEALKEAHLFLSDINLLACCLGPGSFTGIRIGIATIKAFADVKNIPVVGVTSLESLAYNINKPGYICPIIDCKNNNVYSALFYNMEQVGENIAESIDITLNKISDLTSDSITFIGNGSMIHKDLILQKFPNAKFSGDNIHSSISLAECAYNKYLKGDYGASNHISPLYLRKSQAERAKYGD